MNIPMLLMAGIVASAAPTAAVESSLNETKKAAEAMAFNEANGPGFVKDTDAFMDADIVMGSDNFVEDADGLAAERPETPAGPEGMAAETIAGEEKATGPGGGEDTRPDIVTNKIYIQTDDEEEDEEEDEDIEEDDEDDEDESDDEEFVEKDKESSEETEVSDEETKPEDPDAIPEGCDADPNIFTSLNFDNPEKKSYHYENVATVVLPEGKKEGWKFLYWSPDPTDEEAPKYMAGDTYEVSSDSDKLYAVYEQDLEMEIATPSEIPLPETPAEIPEVPGGTEETVPEEKEEVATPSEIPAPEETAAPAEEKTDVPETEESAETGENKNIDDFVAEANKESEEEEKNEESSKDPENTDATDKSTETAGETEETGETESTAETAKSVETEETSGTDETEEPVDDNFVDEANAMSDAESDTKIDPEKIDEDVEDSTEETTTK